VRVTVLALGSRGDVQPFVALGLGLRRAGHCVRIAGAADYEPLARGYGLDFAPLVGSIRDLMDRLMVAAMLDDAQNPVKFIVGTMKMVRPLIKKLVVDVLAACEGAEAIIASTLGLYAGLDVAEKLGIPLYVAHMHPNAPTGAYPHLFVPPLPKWAPYRTAYNRFSFRLADASYWAFILGPLNRARREVLGLPPLTLADVLRRVRVDRRPLLHAYSPSITRRPPDWDARVHVTGYWSLDPPPTWEPPPELVDFIEAGEPPVYVGFGSNLVGRDPDRVTRIVVEALEKAGRRGVLARGWGDLGNIPLPASVLLVDDVPHSWLLPRMAAVVTHGGAGSVAAALRAGVPVVVVPFFGDQLFWARRVSAMGLGPAPVPRHKLSVERLAEAIEVAVSDGAMRARAAAMARKLARERGVDEAVRALGMDDRRRTIDGGRWGVGL
jgi:sterol 3beta-glucosyltransferase